MAECLRMKYFVLKPGGDDEYAAASRAAMLRYAQFIEQENGDFAVDLREWVAETQTAERRRHDQTTQPRRFARE